MNEYVETAKQFIEEENYKEALKLARKRHGKDDVDSYLKILDLLIENEHLPALEEKGIYYQYYDDAHDNGDYGEKYFDEYLEKQPRSVNALCDKAMSRFNKGEVDEALDYMNKAYDKYSSYSKIEKPRISKKELSMAKIELQIQAKRYADALKDLDRYENQFGGDEKSDLYKGQMLQKNGNNREAKVTDDLELVTNFNYKSAFCCIKKGDDQEAVKCLNKTINMLNEHGRLPRELEEIYQKCSFEKERIMKTGTVKDEEFRKTRFFSARTSILILIVIIILYIILKMNGYG